MADPIGLALGFAGLVGLFTACVDSFKLVQIYRQRKDDYDMFQTMLDNQQFHLMAWGQACGFMGTEQPDLKGNFDDPLSAVRNTQIQQTMLAIRSLLTDGHQLKAKYGLKRETPVNSRNIQDTMTPPSAFERVFQGTARFWNTSLQRKSRIKGAVLWTISDKDKFESLIDQLRNLITDLSKLTEAYGVAQSQLWVVRYEMEKIEDEASLEVITQVNSSSPGDDLVSLAASRQLSLVRERSVAVGPGRAIGHEWGTIQPDDSVSLFKKHDIPHIEELDEDVNIGPQPLEITRVLPSQWRNVKTRQGIFPWLGVLIVCTNTASSRPVVPLAVSGPTIAKEPKKADPLSYIRRAITSSDKVPANFTDKESTTSPSRVAINSRTLLAVLAKIIGTRIPESNNVLVYPFKYIVLHADKIRAVYKSVCQECENLEPRNLPGVTINDPNSGPAPPDLGGYANTLVDSSSDEDLLRDISRVKAELHCLIEFMDVDLATLFQTKEACESSGAVDLAFEDLWLYFVPGNPVRLGRDDLAESQCLLILHVTGGRLILDGSSEDPNVASPLPGDIHDKAEFNNSKPFMTTFIIDCLFLDFDGQHIGPRPRRIIILPYKGVRASTSFVVSYARTVMQKKLAVRGQKFLSALDSPAGQVGHFTFSGISNIELEPDHLHTCRYCATTNTQESVEGSVIVDHGAAIRHYRAQSCTFEVQFGQGVVARATQSDPREVFDPFNGGNSSGRISTDIFDDTYIELQRREYWKSYITGRWRPDQLIPDRHPLPYTDDITCLLAPHALAFSLANRRWYALPVSKLNPIPSEPQQSLWDDLILPPQHKNLVLALVSGLGVTTSEAEMHGEAIHEPHPERLSVISQVQRSCLIVLLHGLPGTGKTLLVEGVAEYLRRPVFTINCGELGSAERGAAAKLATWFDLAKRWRCVLLLKEVDAFLEQRGRGDQADRIEIRSVLLRLLQTFDGVTFLSTNRVGILDSAFLSHVNLSLYFPGLDFEQKMRVWQISERRAETDFLLEGEGEQQSHDPDSDPKNRQLPDSELGGFAHSLFQQHPEMNGREIRNMWQTAMSLALYEYKNGDSGNQGNISSKPRLTAKHFSTIKMSMAQFRGYMAAVVGATERHIGSEIRVEESQLHTGNRSQGRSYSPVNVTAENYQTLNEPSSLFTAAQHGDEGSIYYGSNRLSGGIPCVEPSYIDRRIGRPDSSPAAFGPQV